MSRTRCRADVPNRAPRLGRTTLCAERLSRDSRHRNSAGLDNPELSGQRDHTEVVGERPECSSERLLDGCLASAGRRGRSPPLTKAPTPCRCWGSDCRLHDVVSPCSEPGRLEEPLESLRCRQGVHPAVPEACGHLRRKQFDQGRERLRDPGVGQLCRHDWAHQGLDRRSDQLARGQTTGRPPRITAEGKSSKEKRLKSGSDGLDSARCRSNLMCGAGRPASSIAHCAGRKCSSRRVLPHCFPFHNVHQDALDVLQISRAPSWFWMCTRHPCARGAHLGLWTCPHAGD
jgi:hypothetical protein